MTYTTRDLRPNVKSMFCVQCGQQKGLGEKFCANCGTQHSRSPAPPTSKSETPTSSFEQLITERILEARKTSKSNDPLRNTRSTTDLQRGTTSSRHENQSVFFLPQVIFGACLVMIIFGFFIFPFAYTLDNVRGTFGFIETEFHWNVPTISSILRDRDDQGYVFGPSLGYLSGGYILLLLFSIGITAWTVFALRIQKLPARDSKVSWTAKMNLTIGLARFTVVIMALFFAWQFSAMTTLQRAADAEGGLEGDDSLAYFSLGFGSVLSLLGIVGYALGSASLLSRAKLVLVDESK